MLRTKAVKTRVTKIVSSFVRRYFFLNILVFAIFVGAGFVIRSFAQATPTTTYFVGCLDPHKKMLYNVASATTPPPNPTCKPGHSVVDWANGDILSVFAGTGLTGGGLSGEVSLSLVPSFQLPQDCANGQIGKWDLATGFWNCADDSNNVYTAGGGLSLVGTQFSLASAGVLTENIADGAVATAKLAANAATKIESVSRQSASGTNSTAFVDVPFQTVTLTTTGGTVLVMSSASYHMTPGGFTGYWQIVRDDSVVLSHNNHGFSDVGWTTITLFGVDTPPAGLHTYKLQWRVNSELGTLNSSDGVYTENFVATEFKR